MKNNYLFKTLSLILMGFLTSIGWGQTTLNYTGGMQTYIVPAGVTSIQIEAYGAQGGDATPLFGGQGASMQGEFTVIPGTQLDIMVGEQPSSNGGGGGTFVVENGTNVPLIIGGGGGGAAGECCGSEAPGMPGVDTPDGTEGNNVSCTSSTGGTGGNGGSVGTGTYAAGSGGGLLTDGGDGVTPGSGGSSYLNGGAGGIGGNGVGGYGGGGGPDITSTWTNGSGGGGGGYSGGGGNCGSSQWGNGGGGGSYNVGINQVNSSGTNSGNGYAVITVLCSGLTTSVSTDTICDGGTVTLSATSTTGGVITWDNGVVDGVPFTPASTGTTTYTATSSSPADCGFSQDIEMLVLPTIGGIATPDSICLGDAVTVSGTGGVSYTWDNGAVDGVAYVPAVGSGDITYNVTGTDMFGCVNTGTMNLFISDIVVTGVITNENPGGSDGALDITATGGGTYTYLWSHGPTTEDVTGLTGGTYTVTVADGLCSVDEIFVVGTVGIGDNQLTYLEVYPNPTTDYITIKANGYFTYTVYNLLGEVVLSGFGTDTEKVNFEEISSGSYLIRVAQEGNEQQVKLVKN